MLKSLIYVYPHGVLLFLECCDFYVFQIHQKQFFHSFSMLISSAYPIESALVENNVANIPQTFNGSVIIHSFSFNIMFHCDLSYWS